MNKSAIDRRAGSIDFTEEDRGLNIDLKTAVLACPCFAHDRRSAIMKGASLLPFPGGIRSPSHGASKHGATGPDTTLAKEWAAMGINVNAIAPCHIKTNDTEALRKDTVQGDPEAHTRRPMGPAR